MEIGQPQRVNDSVTHNLEQAGVISRDKSGYEHNRRWVQVRGPDQGITNTLGNNSHGVYTVKITILYSTEVMLQLHYLQLDKSKVHSNNTFPALLLTPFHLFCTFI